MSQYSVPLDIASMIDLTDKQRRCNEADAIYAKLLTETIEQEKRNESSSN